MRLRSPNRSDVSLLMSALALFIALGGTSYAVTKLAKNSVGSEQVRDQSLKAVDLAPGVAVSGPRGARGPEGPAGPSGPSGPPGTATTNPAVFRARSVALQTVPAQTATTVLFGGEVFDPRNVWDPQTSRFTAPVDGYYAFQGSLETSYTPQPRRVLVQIESSRPGQVVRGTDLSTTGEQQAAASAVMELRRGDTVWLTIYTDPGANVTANSITWFGGYLISAL